MGTWSHKILGNDTSCEVRERYIELNNLSFDNGNIQKKILEEQQENLELDPTNVWLGLAMISWECKSLTKDLLDKVKNIIEKGIDIELNIELDADSNYLKQREKELQNFLKKITIEKTKPRNRVKPPKLIEFQIKQGDIIKVQNESKEIALILIVFSQHTKTKGELTYINLNSSDLSNLDNISIPRIQKLGSEWGHILYKGKAYSLTYDKTNKDSFIEIITSIFLKIKNMENMDFDRLIFDIQWNNVDYNKPEDLIELISTRAIFDTTSKSKPLTIRELVNALNE